MEPFAPAVASAENNTPPPPDVLPSRLSTQRLAWHDDATPLRHGRWLQLSVFQCRLSARRRAELAARLDALIHHAEDHVAILDLGPADQVDLRVESFGKSYEAPKRRAIVL